MSNFNVLARRFAARLLRRGAPTRRASETVGSNFFLMDRRLSASFKKGGFDALAAEAGAASATRSRFSSSYWLRD